MHLLEGLVMEILDRNADNDMIKLKILYKFCLEQ